MKRIDFENGTVTRNIFSAAIPMLVAQILSLLYNIVDRIYIARIPEVGTTALGAVGLCFPLIVIITAFANLFGSGGAPVFSINRGMKDNQKAQEVMNTSFTMVCGSGIILMIAGMLFARPLLVLFGASEDAFGLCISLHDDLPDRNDSIHDRHRNEPVYQCTGIRDNRYVFCSNWCSCQSDPGSIIHFCAWFRNQRSSHCDCSFPVLISCLCTSFS